MADDPRIEPVEDYLFAQFGGSVGEVQMAALAIIGEADCHDRLRALLSDEGRARELVAECIAGPGVWEHLPDGSKYLIRQNGAARVLAALRGVAGLSHCKACSRPLPHTLPELAACQRSESNHG